MSDFYPETGFYFRLKRLQFKQIFLFLKLNKAFKTVEYGKNAVSQS